MSELDDLYQEFILDHNRRPRNRGELVEANKHAEGFNPLCGDRVDVFLILDGDVITDIKFDGKGCAISTASASLMTESVKGRTIDEAAKLFESFHHIVTEGADDVDAGKLIAFAGVSRFPARVKCATLAWHTLKAALRETAPRNDDVVTTE